SLHIAWSCLNSLAPCFERVSFGKPAPDLWKIVDCLSDGRGPSNGCKQRMLGYSHPLPYSKQNHTVPALRNPKLLRLNDVVGGLQRVTVPFFCEGTDFVFKPFGGG